MTVLSHDVKVSSEFSLIPGFKLYEKTNDKVNDTHLWVFLLYPLQCCLQITSLFLFVEVSV